MGKNPWQRSDIDDAQHSQNASQGSADTSEKRLAEIRERSGAAYDKIYAEKVARANRQTPSYIRLIIFLMGIGLLLFGLSLATPDTEIADPYLIRSVLILMIFGGAAAFWSRSSIWRLAKFAGGWIVVIVAVYGFYLYQSDIGDRFMAVVDPSGGVTDEGEIIISRSNDGHFWMRVKMNGTPIRAMVDTGASNIVLSPDDARNVGINTAQLTYSGRAETANGSVKFARTTVDSLELGNHTYRDMKVTVNGTDMRGALLGLSVLNNFSSIEFRGNTLILRP